MGILPKMLTRVFDLEDMSPDELVDEEPRYGILGKIIDVSVGEIVPSPSQPRKHFSTAELTSLAKSISQDGIISPLMVRRTGGHFELISGERRLRAAKLAGLRSVPCILVQSSDEKSQVIGLIENLQRSDLDFFEQAEAFSALIGKFSLTQESLAIRLGMSQSAVANKLRLLRLDKEEREMILSSGLSERHARALLKVTDKQLRAEILDKTVQNCWTVDRCEKYIDKILCENEEELKYKKRAVMLKDVRLFFNTVNKAVNIMKMAGVEAQTRRIDHKGYIEYIITIPQDGSSQEEQKETVNNCQ